MCSKDKQKERLNLVSKEINISKYLCSNDIEKRKRGISSLKSFLSSTDTAVEENDYKRIWTGLFYYLWISDKPLVQEETAERISNLLHLIKNTKSQVLFIRTCFLTLAEKWSKISTHRMDKFLMFIRRFLRQCLNMLRKKEWAQEAVEAFSLELYEIIQILPLSLITHLDDIFVEEVAKVTNGNIATESLVTLMKGFLECIANLKPSMAVVADIQTKIFGALSKQRKLSMREPPPEENDGDSEVGENESSEKENNVEEKCIDDEIPLDPRPGKVDVILPFIEFDEKPFIIMFKSYRDKIGVMKKAKNIIVALINMYESITTLRKRIEDIRVKGPKDDAGTINRRRRIAQKEALLNAIEKINKSVKKKKRKSDHMLNKQLEELGDLIRIKGKNKKSKLISNRKTNRMKKNNKSQWIVTNIDEGNKSNMAINEKDHNGSITSNSGTWIITDITNDEQASRNESINASIDNNWTETNIEKKITEESVNQEIIENKEQNSNGNGIPEVIEIALQVQQNDNKTQDLEEKTEEMENSKEESKKIKGRKRKVSQDATSTPNQKKKSLTKSAEDKKGSRKETLRSYSSFVKGLEKEEPEDQMVLHREHPDWQTVPKAHILECMDEVSKQNVKGNCKVLLTNIKIPSENGEGKVDSNVNECMDKANEKNVMNKCKVLLNDIGTPPENVKRKVKFTLDKNSSQGMSDYNTSIELNPNVPYSPAKEPNKGVLKPSAVASPINPFYRIKLARAKKRSLI